MKWYARKKYRPAQNYRDRYPPANPYRDTPWNRWFCKTFGHWHSFKTDNGGSGHGHSATCLRCGWQDPCVWT